MKHLKRYAIWTFSLLFSIGLLAGCAGKKAPEDPWAQLEEIKAQITPPKFPDRTFAVTDYGAVGDGQTKNTGAFRAAIAAAHESGGGKVVVPEGVFLTGAIHLKSGVNLHLAEGARILFSQDPADYLPVVFSRFEGVEYMNYSPFIYAYEQENIAITGQGVLDGNADEEHWWPWAHVYDDRDRLLEMNAQQVPPRERIFGAGHKLRPNFVQFYKCENVLISGVKLVRSPMWNIHPVLSHNVIIDGVRIESLGPNNDGVNPESSTNVWIKNSYFDTGDDCIAIKSGRNEDGRRIDVPSKNIIVEHCRMKEGHGGIVLGSEISGGVRNVFAQHLRMDSPNLDRVLRIKTNTKRGGLVENIYLRDINVGQYKEAAIKVNTFYSEETGDFMPVIRNILVEDLKVENGGEYGILINVHEESPVTNLRVVDSIIKDVGEPVKVNHVENMRLENVTINGQVVNWEPENKGQSGKVPE